MPSASDFGPASQDATRALEPVSKAPSKISVSALATPAGFLAIGAGTGLAPRAPGTVGTILGIPLVLVMPTALLPYLLVLGVLALVGIWCCDRCASELGVHDHPGIVWDEIVGYAVTMIAAPRGLFPLLLGFALFRLFDILKPWPISVLDARLQGGLGIMADDILAGVFAAIALQLLLHVIY